MISERSRSDLAKRRCGLMITRFLSTLPTETRQHRSREARQNWEGGIRCLHRTDQRQRQGRAVYVWCSGRQCAAADREHCRSGLQRSPVTVRWLLEVTGVAFSPGFLTFAGGPIAAGPGIVTLRCHAKSAVISGITGANEYQRGHAGCRGSQRADRLSPASGQRPAPDDDKVDLFYKTVGLRMTFKSLRHWIITVAYTGETAGSGVPSLSDALNCSRERRRPSRSG